jgi:hypothetical protein
MSELTLATTEGEPDALPPELTWLEGGQSYVACAFYTPNYLPVVLSLKASLDKFGINYFLKCVERKTTWEATTRLKPVFVAECLRRFPDRDILYLDADAVVRQPLDFIATIKSDVGMLFHPNKYAGRLVLRISAGTVFVRNTPGGRKFADAWKAQEAKAGVATVDEDMIYQAWPELEGVSITVMPLPYYKVFDSPGGGAVIEHFQASRSQTKIRKSIRRTMQLAGWAVGGVILLALLARLAGLF